MPAFVKADFGVRPVKALRFKKGGVWKEVTKAYIKVGDNLKLWWPNFNDIIGTSSTSSVTLAMQEPRVAAWNPVNNNYIVISKIFLSGSTSFQYVNYSSGANIHSELWRDYRNGTDQNGYSSFQPQIVDAYALKDGSGFWLLDTKGLRRYLINEFGTLKDEWIYRTSSSPLTFATTEEIQPTLTIGADPIYLGKTYSGVFVQNIGFAYANVGYVNSPDGKEAYFGKNTSFAVDPDEEFAYVVDSDNKAIRKVSLTPPYAVTTLAGSPPTGTSVDTYTVPPYGENLDGIGLDARFRMSSSGDTIAVHPSGDYLFVSQTASGARRIRKIWLRDVGDKVVGQVETWAIEGVQSGTFDVDIQPNRVPDDIRDIAFDPSGRWLYLIQNYRISKIDLDTEGGFLSVIAGRNSSGYADSEEDASLVRFTNLQSMDVNSSNGWIIATENPSGGNNDRVRFIF